MGGFEKISISLQRNEKESHVWYQYLQNRLFPICYKYIVERLPQQNRGMVLKRKLESNLKKETVDWLSKANGVRRHRHVLRRIDEYVLRAALDLKVSGRKSKDDQRRPGRSKWKRRQRRLVLRRRML